MDQQRKPTPPATPTPPPAEIQQGDARSIGKDERLKRVIRQHPFRDEPKVDSVEPGETRGA